MNAARLREHYQQSQLLLSELQTLDSDPYGLSRSNGKHVQLIRLAFLLARGASSIVDPDSRAVWDERARSLHRELIALTALRLQHTDQSGEEFWEGCVHLLYVAAEAGIKAENEVSDLHDAIAAEREKAAKAQQASQILQQQRETSSKDNMEMRTRIVMLQQEIQRKDADVRDLSQQWHEAVAERDVLRSERQNVIDEGSKNAEKLERQAKVILQMMDQNEIRTRERDDAVASSKRLDEDNHVLRVNLGQHAQVIEKLIALNTELMDSSNARSLELETYKRQREESEAEQDTQSRLIHDGSEQLQIDAAIPISLAPGQGMSEDEEEHFCNGAVDSSLQNPRLSTAYSPRHLRTSAEPFGSIESNAAGNITPATPSSIVAPGVSIIESTKPHYKGTSTTEASQQGPVKWTSDALLSATTQESTAGLTSLAPSLPGAVPQSNFKLTSNRVTPVDDSSCQEGPGPRGNAFLGRLGSVGGKAKSLLYYVAGADKVQ